MSLLSLLLSSRSEVDTELDVLFKSNLHPTARDSDRKAASSPGPSEHVAKKRKVAPDTDPTDDTQPDHAKRAKPIPKKSSKKGPEGTSPSKPSKGAKGSKEVGSKGKTKEVEVAEDGEDQSDLENASLNAQQAHNPDVSPDDDEESDGEPHFPPAHESLQKDKKRSQTGAKSKFVPADETAEQRDKRTIFVGNLSIEVAQKRPLLKQLQRHIIAQIPTAKIESTRFRSIPFQAPTSKLPTSDDEATPSKEKTQASKQGRAHDRERTSTWREKSEKEKDDDTGKSDEKKFLDPKQKKKIAFINQEFHPSADTVHAYIVFAHPLPPESRPSNLPPPPPTMDPYEAAQLAARQCDGTSFMDRIIRVDLVNKKALNGEKRLHSESSILDTDPKLSVFVGNLDFASKEEDLRVFFEGVVSTERGPPGANSNVDEDGAGATKKPTTWVSRVRIVRDKDTQLGKGFAYVQFADRGCVDEVLALDQSKLKFAKRKLRVQRCKTIPGSSTSTRHVTADVKSAKGTRDANPKPQGPTPAPTPIIIPKGDPSLGKKLAHLPKEARKQYKSSDADRVARRLAKKKARIALGNKGVKPLGKERERVRKDKDVGADKGRGKRPVKESKGRVRSEKSLMKRNMKK